jgi:hypothetical protein
VEIITFKVWSNGVVEEWSDERKKKLSSCKDLPTLQYSSTPILQQTAFALLEFKLG